MDPFTSTVTYYRQCKSDKWDTEGSFKWLVEGRLQGTTEALVLAAQGGLIMTSDYQKRIGRRLSSLSCRLLSKCEPLQWSLYKERHDRVVYQIVLGLPRKYQLELPTGLKWGSNGWCGVGVLENKDAKVIIDLNISHQQYNNREQTRKSSSLKSLAVTFRELWPGKASRPWLALSKLTWKGTS